MENFYAPKAKFNFKLPFSKFTLPSFKLKNSKVTDLPDRSVSGISKKTFKFPWKILLKSVGILLLVIVILLAIVGLIYGKPAYDIYKASKKLQDSSYGLKTSLKTQDLEQINLNLNAFEKDYEEFKVVYFAKSPKLKTLPFVKNYVTDVDTLMNVGDKSIALGYLFLDTLEPYASDLGLKKGAEHLTNEQRITRLAEVLPKISGEVTKLSGLIGEIDTELQKIDATKYPETINGTPVREQIVSLQAVTSQLAEKSPKFKVLFEQLPALIGVGEKKTYLVLMANSLELRMNGGFTTFGVVVSVLDGVPTIERSVDTYFIDVDDSALVNTNVPYFLRDYLRVNRLYVRDALSVYPDYTQGVDLFINRYWNIHQGGAAGYLPPVDGVISVNTHLAEKLLEVLGPVNVSGRSFKTDEGTYKGFGDTEFSSDNVLYNLEVIANSDLSQIQGRKDIIMFLMESIINNVLNAKTENLIPLSSAFLEALGTKDVMIYVTDPVVQAGIDELNYSGRVIAAPDNTWDYNFILHSNFGGGKRDWLVTRETSKSVYIKDGLNFSKINLVIKNPKAPDWWEPSWLYAYPDYVRIYVPKGSKLADSKVNLDQEINVRQMEDTDHNLDFIEFFVRIPEGESADVTIEYELPSEVDLKNYKLFVQKQSGIHNEVYTVTRDNEEKKVILNSDLEVRF